MIARAIVVFPQPDSPASARTSPRRSCKVTPSTARASAPSCPPMPAPSPTRPANVTCEVPHLEHRRRPAPDRGRLSTLTRLLRRVRHRALDQQAGGPASLAGRVELGHDGRAFVERDRAPGVERAPGRDRLRVAAGRRRDRTAARGSDASPIAGKAAASAFVYGCCGVPNTSRGRALLDDPARVHDRQAVRDLDEHREVVGDEQHREPQLALEVLQQLEDLGLDHDVEGGGRLVGDDQVGAARERHRDHDALLLAARELVRVVPQPAGGSPTCSRRAPARHLRLPRAGLAGG